MFCQRPATLKGTIPNGRHRLGDCDVCQRPATLKGKIPNGRHRLGDCHLDHPVVPLKGSSRYRCERGRDVDLKQALCMDCLCCCGFNFVSGVNDSHLRFGMQQPRRLQGLIIIYQQCVGQDLYFEDFALNGIFTMLLFTEHCLQFFNGDSWHGFNGEDTNLLRSSLLLHVAWRPWRKSCKIEAPLQNVRCLKSNAPVLKSTLYDKLGGSLTLRHNYKIHELSVQIIKGTHAPLTKTN